MKFSVGDRVKVYGWRPQIVGMPTEQYDIYSNGDKGTISRITPGHEIVVDFDDETAGEVHPKQCRKLVKVNNDDKVANIVNNLVEVYNLYIDVSGSSYPHEVFNWIMTSNESFFNSSPFAIILQGDGKDVIDYLKTKLGTKPGVAF